jgi:hypothetical protein
MMITTRMAPLTGTPAPAAGAAIPGDWPGPTLNDLPSPTQIMVGG